MCCQTGNTAVVAQAVRAAVKSHERIKAFDFFIKCGNFPTGNIGRITDNNVKTAADFIDNIFRKPTCLYKADSLVDTDIPSILPGNFQCAFGYVNTNAFRLRQFGRYWGWRTWAILIVLCAGWFGAVYAEGGNEYLDNLLFHQTLDRAVNAFHHERPFYFYAISVWYSIAPWSLAVIGLIVAAACKKLITTDLQQFFVTIMLTTFVMLSCISSKVHIYLLPAFPFMVYTGMMFMPAFSRTKWLKLTIAIPSAAIAASLPALAVIANGKDTSWLGLPAFYAAAAILSASGIYAIISLYGKRGGADKAVRTIAVGMLAAVFAGGWALPQVKEQIGYGALCEKALEVSQATGTTDFCTWNIKRSENMDVYLHRDVEIIPKEETPKAEAGRTKVLMTRTRDASTFKGCKTYTVGKYAVILLE